jgi:hypothetical protein
VTKSNSTYGQPTLLTIRVNDGKALNYTSIKFTIPKTVALISANSNLSIAYNPNDYVVTLNTNSNFEGSQIKIEAVNPDSTVSTG